MIVKAPEERFSTAPEGTFAAVCVDEIDLGIVTSSYAGQERERHMVRLVWQLAEEDDQGNPYQIKQDYTASLHEKAGLRKALQSWRGKAFTDIELFGFDMETLVGAGCLINVIHNKGSKGGTFANVGGLMKLPKNLEKPEPRGYTRVKDRKKEAPQSAPRTQKPPEEAPPANWEITDDDIPF